ncbi:hypothetical protein CC117_00745 [Parafrankia colletiae]|uniref:Helix-turn-helix domain-containing protein n=1 Tax=Parafrankia colletiae TaxID=573497 RepID=A0A1S1RJJ5_9ACTN|nr:helix-turn-helix domain-containing protein [Parafrankia colletiae]MCK9904277.1 helix-turn-helix domain-containing protein [Frankia sp. Cpl3]OHV46217.1 hypothetical protein CC117_00745 [Parafrankia colletiae]
MTVLTTTPDAAASVDPLAELPPLISVEKAAAVMGFSRASAYRYIKAGELPSKKLGGRVFVVTAHLRALLTPDIPAPAEVVEVGDPT